MLLLAGLGHEPLAVDDVLLRRVRASRASGRSSSAARARGARWPASRAPVALLALVRRNRRRYGGYVVHIGMAVLFIGVAASSSFQHASELQLRPGQSTHVGAYTVRYVRPTASVTPKYDRAHTGSTLSLGAVSTCSKNGHHVATLQPERGLLRLQEPAQGSVGSLIGGQAVSHVSDRRRRHARCLERDLARTSTPRAEADRRRRATARSAPKRRSSRSAFLARSYLKNPPPAQFHFIVSPLVMWIWIGGLIVFGGGADRDLAGAERRRVRGSRRGRALPRRLVRA